jgi:threonine-phosphate decarboxylase
MDVTHGGGIFAAARQIGCDWRDIADFSASINPLGPAPQVRSAISKALDEIVHYPDPNATRLIEMLAETWKVEPECILAGNGATELIHFAARMWRGEVTLVIPVFSEFHRAFPGARLMTYGSELPDDGLLVLTNPVNPTGAASDLPQRSGISLVDESFIEFSDLRSRIGEALVLRSLTKFQAIPGLRVGALVGPVDMMRKWRQYREPWQVNVLAEAAALAALGDQEHYRRTREYVRTEQARLWNALASLPGVRLHPTQANFYFAELRYSADALCDYMLRNRLLLRNCSGWPGVRGEAVRFAVRTRGENDKLIALWRAFPCD